MVTAIRPQALAATACAVASVLLISNNSALSADAFSTSRSVPITLDVQRTSKLYKNGLIRPLTVPLLSRLQMSVSTTEDEAEADAETSVELTAEGEAESGAETAVELKMTKQGIYDLDSKEDHL